MREIFFDWLRTKRPDLVERYEHLYRRGAFSPCAGGGAMSSAPGAGAAPRPGRRRGSAVAGPREEGAATARREPARSARRLRRRRPCSDAPASVLTAHVRRKRPRGALSRNRSDGSAATAGSETEVAIRSLKPVHASTPPALRSRHEAARARHLTWQTGQRARRAKRQLALLVPLTAGTIAAYIWRKELFGTDVPVRVVDAFVLVALGWALARDLGRARCRRCSSASIRRRRARSASSSA